jgi:hypothetical protein
MWVLLFPFGILIVVIGSIAAIVIYSWQKEKDRTLALQKTAGQLGWNFMASAPMNMIPFLDRFALFSQGHGKQIKNFMYGEATGIKAAAFDYVYVTGSGRNRQTHLQTVVYIEPTYLQLPYFSLRSENFLLKIFSALGYQDIDFGQRPVFSKQYILRGQDEPAIRRVFTDQLLAFYETYGGTSTDGGGNQLFLYRGGYRFQPQEIQGYVGLALNLAGLFPRYY